MKIIDIHTHVYPDPIAQKATDSIKDFYKLVGDRVPAELYEELASLEARLSK